MPKKTYHIIREKNGKWKIKEARAAASQTFRTQKEAIRYATKNLGKYANIVVVALMMFVSLVCTPLSAFSEKIPTEPSSKELRQYQDLYSALSQRCNTLARHHVESNKEVHETDLLISVGHAMAFREPTLSYQPYKGTGS